MSDLANRLRIKYGTAQPPSPASIERWVVEVERLLKEGFAPEEAGRAAAKVALPGAETMIFESEADTLEALLNEAKNK